MGQKRFLEIGKITNVHGLHGEVKVYPWCDDAAFLCSFDTLYTDKAGKHPVEIVRARVQQNMVILQLAGCETREQAEAMRGTVLYMDRDDVELDDGCYFIHFHDLAETLLRPDATWKTCFLCGASGLLQSMISSIRN